MLGRCRIVIDYSSPQIASLTDRRNWRLSVSVRRLTPYLDPAYNRYVTSILGGLSGWQLTPRGAWGPAVNNAGVCVWGGVPRRHPEAFSVVTGVNVKGTFLCARRADQIMTQQEIRAASSTSAPATPNGRHHR